MAGLLPRGRLGGIASQAAGRPSSPPDRQTNSMDLPDGDHEESVAVEVSVCLVDARDDRQTDCGSVRRALEHRLGGTVAGAVGFDLPASALCGLRAESQPGGAMAAPRISPDSRPSPQNR